MAGASNPICKVCDKGELQKKKTYRLSGPAVVIGYIFLIPCFFGMLLGIMMLISTGSAGSVQGDQIKQEFRNELQSALIPQPIITKLVNGNEPSQNELLELNEDQMKALEDAKTTHNAKTAGTAIGTGLAGGLSLFVIITSFVGGLLGWILTMKKKVLKCKTCGAIVQAS